MSILMIWGCTQEEGPFQHSLTESDMMIDSIYYLSSDGEVVMGVDPSDSATWEFNEVMPGDSFTVRVMSQYGELNFTDIAGKYLNSNGSMYFSGNQFESFFPKEWEPLRKHGRYATMKFEKDERHFFFLTVDYGTETTIGSYFEKW
jgi:hypothetical protein